MEAINNGITKLEKYFPKELTKKYIAAGENIIYEAAFEFNNLLVFADILVRDNDKWKIYEVKASTKQITIE